MNDSPRLTRIPGNRKVHLIRTPREKGSRDLPGHRSNLSGPKGNRTRKENLPRGPRRERTTTGPRTGPRRLLRDCNSAGTSYSGTSALAIAAGHMVAQWSRMGGPAMAPIAQISVPTNEKGGRPSSKRVAPPFQKHHPHGWKRQQTIPLHRGRRLHRPFFKDNNKQPRRDNPGEDRPLANFNTSIPSTQPSTLVNDRSDN